MNKQQAAVYEKYKNSTEVAMFLLLGEKPETEKIERKINGDVIVVEKKEVYPILKELFEDGIIFKDVAIEDLLKRKGCLIQYIEEPTEEQQVIALTQEIVSKRYIKNLCDKAKEILLTHTSAGGYIYADKEDINNLNDAELMHYLAINPKLATMIEEDRWTQDMVTEYLRKMVQDNRSELIGDYQNRVHIPEKFRDKIYYRSYCMVDGYNYSKIPVDKRDEYIMPKLIWYTLEHSKSYVGTLWMFQYLPEKFKTEDICLECCVKHFGCVKYLPKQYHSNDFYKKLFDAGRYNILDDVDYSKMSEELIVEAIENSYGSWQPNIPSKYITEKVAMALARIPRALEAKIPKKFLTKEWYEEHARLTGELGSVPEKYRTEELCISAVIKKPLVSRYAVPEKCKTKKYWETVIENMAFSKLTDIPEEYLTEDLIVNYFVEHKYNALQEIPEELRSEELFVRIIEAAPYMSMEILKISDSVAIVEATKKAFANNSISDNYARFRTALEFKETPREIIEEFIEKRADAILLKGLTEEDIKRSLEKFPENVLYVSEKEYEKSSETLVVTQPKPISLLPDVSVFEQISIWDILSA